jgi:hypothetical protein
MVAVLKRIMLNGRYHEIILEKVRVSGGQTGIAEAVLAWSPTVAVHSTWA